MSSKPPKSQSWERGLERVKHEQVLIPAYNFDNWLLKKPQVGIFGKWRIALCCFRNEIENETAFNLYAINNEDARMLRFVLSHYSFPTYWYFKESKCVSVNTYFYDKSIRHDCYDWSQEKEVSALFDILKKSEVTCIWHGQVSQGWTDKRKIVKHEGENLILEEHSAWGSWFNKKRAKYTIKLNPNTSFPTCDVSWANGTSERINLEQLVSGC